MKPSMVAVALYLMSTGASASPPPQAEAGPCDRLCLEGRMNAFLDAMTHHAAGAAPLSPDIKYSENQVRLAPGEGLWRTLDRLGSYRILASDLRNQQIAFIGNARTRAGWTMLAVRLRVAGGRISEAEVIAPGAAAATGTFDLSTGAGKLTTARPAFSTDLTRDERRDRVQIIQAADLHYEGIERGNGDIVPFGDDCIKIENGIQLIRNPDFRNPGVSPAGKPVPNFTAMGCRDQFNTHIWDTDTITDRRYPVVDEERGIVVAFAMYNQYIKAPCAVVVDVGPVCPPRPVKPYTLVMAEAFKVRGGFIEEVESVFTPTNTVTKRGIW